MIEAHSQFMVTLSDAEKELHQLCSVGQQVIALVDSQQLDKKLALNPYTNYEAQVRPLPSPYTILFEYTVLIASFFCPEHYFVYSLKEIDNKWREMRSLVVNREAKLSKELERQKENERLRKQFAQKANVVGPWLEAHIEATSGIFTSKVAFVIHLIHQFRF